MATTIATAPETERRSTTPAALSRLLADTLAAYHKTLYYHWNVSGPQFRSLHLMFEEQYQELQLGADVVAERIRQLGATTPPFGEQMASLTTVPGDRDAPRAMDMVQALVDAHETVVETARECVGIAEQHGDVATVDIVTERIEAHEKATWMLRATSS